MKEGDILNERIKKIRRHLGFSQKEFAEKLGLTQSGVSWMEQQGKTVSDQNIRLICTLFDVNENWLRTGEEPMLVQSEDSLIEELATEYNLSNFDKTFIENFINLSPEKRLAFKDFINSFMTPSE